MAVMKSANVPIFLVGLGFLVTATAMFTFEEDGPKCKGEPVKLDVKMSKYFKECMEEFKTAQTEKKDGPKRAGKTCLALCAMTKIGDFDDKGVLQPEKVNAGLDYMFPAKYAGEIKTEAAKCAETHKMDTVNIANSDYLCSAYKPYFNCTGLAMMKACIENFDPQIWNADD